MATRDRNLGTSVRRYSASSMVQTQVQPTYQGGSGNAQMFENFRKGFDKGIQFLAPAVKQEAAGKGEKEALEAIDNNTFELRKPFTLRDEAFNTTGEKVIENKAMIQLDDGLHAAMKKADGNITVLGAEMEKVRTKLLGSVPDIPGLETNILNTFERGAAAAKRSTTALAERRAIAAQKQAAIDAINLTQRETERLAFLAGSPEELAGALTDAQERLVKYGPKGAFTLNGVEYAADPKRSGLYTTGQLATSVNKLAGDSHELFLRAAVERSEAPMKVIREFEKEFMAGNSPVPFDKGLKLISEMEGKVRADQARELAAMNAIEKQVDERVDVYLKMGEDGYPTAIPDDERQALLDQVAGNALLTQKVQGKIFAADAMVEMHGMTAGEIKEYTDAMVAKFQETPGIQPGEAAAIKALTPVLKAVQKSITEESVGLTAAESFLMHGNEVTSEMLAEMRSGAGNNQKIQRSIDVLEEASMLIAGMKDLSGAEWEKISTEIDENLAELAAEGEVTGVAYSQKVEALEMARQYAENLETDAKKNVVGFAGKMGIPLAAWPEGEDATLADVANTVVARVTQVSEAAKRFGNENPVPLTPVEREMITDFMKTATSASKLSFVDKIVQLPRDQATAVLKDIGQSDKTLISAGGVYEYNPGAAALMLKSSGIQVGGDTPTNKLAGQEVVNPLISMGWFSSDDVAAVMDGGMAYAKGRALQDGRTEIDVEDLKDGIDIAFGADQNGRGGLEEVGSLGMTVLPAGVSGKEVDRRLWRHLTDPDLLEQLAGGVVQDGDRGAYSGDDLYYTIESLQPGADGVLTPLDGTGAAFPVLRPDGTLGALQFNVFDLVWNEQ